ncbi:MAG: diguanylate cyclase [Armatimonadetes bacterium]|nr:diguanylate cyclase [Armatimonadota bacterium]
MRNLGDLSLEPVWLNPTHRVKAARVLLAGHRVKALAVIENNRVVGVVTAETIARVEDGVELSEVMAPPQPVLDSHLAISRAAERFYTEDLDFALVMEDDRFLGVLTPNILLQEHRFTWDPLTNLGRIDRMRDWAIGALSSGSEISLLFIDLNDFGLYNKQYGHAVGDRVLRRVSALLRECIDSRTDLLVRYGGDEFAVGTLRLRADAEQLAMVIQERAEAELFDDLGRPITFCIGISGGRRTQERANTHYVATFENLLNAASQACMAAKAEVKKFQANGR